MPWPHSWLQGFEWDLSPGVSLTVVFVVPGTFLWILWVTRLQPPWRAADSPALSSVSQGSLYESGGRMILHLNQAIPTSP